MHLGRPPRLSLRLLPLTGTLRRCFVLYTFSNGADNLPIRTDKICPNHSYRAACHGSTTRDVALDAFNSKLFSLGTYFSSLCDPKLHLGRHPWPYTHSRMHRHMYTATYRTVCYGWRVGMIYAIFIVTATAGPNNDLTLNSVLIFLKYIILPLIRPSPPANGLVNLCKLHFSVGITEVRSR